MPETDRAGDQALVVFAPAGVGAVVPVDTGKRIEWTLEQQITTWLAEKGKGGKSARTEATYRAGLASYRALLQAAGLDLDSADVTALATLLQGWAARPRTHDGQDISAALHNQRIALVSSFYRFRMRRYKLGENPADTVERQTVQAYARAKPLAADDVRAGLAAIDRVTLAGRRDYALLAVALYTGRRLSEIAAMRRRDLTISGQGVNSPTGSSVTIIFPHAKGGKVLTNVLNRPTSAALLDWLAAFYGVEALHSTLAADAPVWVALARTSRRGAGAYGEPLGIQAIADVCKRRMGVSKVHTLRHSFAHTMEALGTKVSDIQAALGHSNIATTGVYLTALNSGENTHGDALSDAFGITATPPARRGAGARITRPLGKTAQQK